MPTVRVREILFFTIPTYLLVVSVPCLNVKASRSLLLVLNSQLLCFENLSAGAACVVFLDQEYSAQNFISNCVYGHCKSAARHEHPNIIIGRFSANRPRISHFLEFIDLAK
ncbi:hypothetical protein CEXT_169981 [Caerostris extrusa]|uniref:Secreted protein n=1 Tax=Caerostris extrusa TaxID=172846 RepID=A0AAV4UBZ3_CAEEX|nr:hypothetical protein CEXT_169981 [Caerostris extrusa]